jgi:hypothetical protein
MIKELAEARYRLWGGRAIGRSPDGSTARRALVWLLGPGLLVAGVPLSSVSESTLAAPSLGPNDPIRGTVVDAERGTPVHAAQVWLLTEDDQEIRVTYTDAEGHFLLMPPGAGRYVVKAQRLGFHPARVGPFDWTDGWGEDLEIALSPSPLGLEAIEVEGRRSLPAAQAPTYEGLHARREDARPVGSERIFVREDLEAAVSGTIGQFVYAQNVPGLGRSGVMPPSGSRASFGLRTGCVPHLIWGSLEAMREVPYPDEWGHIMDLPLREMEGIELYGRASQAPPALRPFLPDDGIYCGLVVLWPRLPGR